MVEIPRFRRHCLGRGDEGLPSLSESRKGKVDFLGKGGDVGDEGWNQDLLVREWTDPQDGQKEVFFRNLAGVVSEPKPTWVWGWLWGWWIELQVWIVGGELDNYSAIIGGRWRWVEWVVVHAVCVAARVLGGVLGLRGVYGEYTPIELRREGRKGR